MAEWNRDWPREKWKAQLEQKEDDAEVSAIRLCTTRGRPLCTDSFMSKLERRLGKRLRALPVGRPKINRQKSKKRKSAAKQIGDCPLLNMP